MSVSTHLQGLAAFGADDRYGVEREIGRGATSTVFLAHDRKHGRKVALKVLHPELAAAMESERFLREVQLVAKLQHPHILPLYDSGQVGGALYFVMPYVEGDSLRDRLARERQLPVADALRIVREVAGALQYAHDLGVVHRDIKPENILLSSGQPVLSDFGVARAISRASGEFRSFRSGETRPSHEMVMVGTPAYVSPEQASGDPTLDGRADQFALACVLYEMLAGAPPFSGSTPQETLARRFTERPPPLLAARPELSPALENVVLRALSVTPADRYPTVEQFALALSAEHRSVATATAAASPDGRRRRWWKLF